MKSHSWALLGMSPPTDLQSDSVC